MRSHWEQIKLADLFELQMGKTPAREKDQYWKNGDNKWVSIADIGKFLRYTNETKEKITDIAISESGIKQVPKNTLIMSFKLSLGKVAITSEPIYTNEAIMAFIDRKKRPLSLSFLFHLFKNKDWSAGTNKAVLGMTLNKATLKEISIPVPPLLEQEEIAQKLDAVCRLITLRKQQLQKLDQLASSRFIEMFGDPEDNPRKWCKLPLKDSVVRIENGKSPVCENFSRVGTNPAVLKLSSISSGYFKATENKALQDGVPFLSAYEVHAGDLLISRKNTLDLVGKACYVFETPEFLQLPDLIFRLDLTHRIHGIFLCFLFNHPSFRPKVQALAGGSAGSMPNISKSRLENLIILVPPIELQNEFAAFVEQLDKSKVIGEKQRFILEKITCIYILW